MAFWLIWIICGVVMMLLELLVPGGIIIFLGLAAVVVGTLLYFGWITSLFTSFTSWFLISIIFLLFLRALFSKYFGGNYSIQNTNEDLDLVGVQVTVIEDIFPYRKGSVKLREVVWTAKSDETIRAGSEALVFKRDGNDLVVKVLDL